MADIFDQPKTDMVPILHTSVDADSPNSALIMEKIRDALEMLIINVHGMFDSGELTADPPNDTTGYATDSISTWTDDEHNGRRLLFTSGNAIGQDFLIDDTDDSNNRVICTGDNLYAAGARDTDEYIIVGNFRDTTYAGHVHDNITAPPTVADTTIEEMQDGSVMLPFNMAAEESAITETSTGWQDKRSYSVYIPDDATTIVMSARTVASGTPPPNPDVHVRFDVDGNQSAAITNSTGGWVWGTTTLDVSSISGSVILTIQMLVYTSGDTGELQGFSFWWQQ